jgi:hypothetical protein
LKCSMRASLGALFLGVLTLAQGCATPLPELGHLGHLAPREERSLLHTADTVPSRLTLSELQLKGSHNSYHRAPRIALSRKWRYSHAPLEVQLANQSVRQLELDVRYVRGELMVTHLPLVDGRSSCKRLVDCLQSVKKWSRAHPSHLPIFVMIEIKEDFAPSRLDGRLDAIDFAITRVFPRDMLLTPERVAGTSASLREAVLDRGWPTIEETRGQIAFVMFGPRRHKRAYTRDRPRLEGRLMFVAEARTTLPHSSVLFFDDPVARADQIAAAVRQNFLVRTRADAHLVRTPRRRDAALASGAHFISSDFVDPRFDWLELGDSAPGRCNPVAASARCNALALSESEEPAVARAETH